MIYKKELLILISVIISIGGKTEIKSFASKVRNMRKVDSLKETENLIKNVDFVKMFKNLRQNQTPEEIQIITTLGLVSGALKVADILRENMFQMTDDLLDSFNKSTPKENMLKLLAIEDTIIRDKSAVAVLNGMLKFARNITTLQVLDKDMKQILSENELSSKRLRSKKLAIERNDERNETSTGKLLNRSGMNLKYTVKEKLYDVREMIDNHVENVQSSVTENVKLTIKYIQKLQQQNEKLMQVNDFVVKLDPSLNAVRRIWNQMASSEETSDNVDGKNDRIFGKIRLTKGEKVAIVIKPKSETIKIETNVNRPKRQFRVEIDIDGPTKRPKQDINEIDTSKSQEDKLTNDKGSGDRDTNEKQTDDKDTSDKETGDQSDENDFSESSDYSEPGGLVGLITNLSGGDEGSDVNAVIGALSQVVSNLLGPGGLDIPVLVSSGTAAFASLLAGDDNFGYFLGNVIGLSIEGFSGGGGAANNGQFSGQFLGKLLSILSANQDMDDGPLQPDIFIKNIYNGIGIGLNKTIGDENNPECEDDCGGSDSSGFIKTIVSSIIQLIAKASMGSSASSSQGSVQGVTSLSGGSSSSSSGASANLSGSSSGSSSDSGSKDKEKTKKKR